MTNLQVSEVLEDKRVQEILTGLASGKTREELAVVFNHKTYKTLDIYMRRKEFTWDTVKQNYILKRNQASVEPAQVHTSKASRIIQLLKENAGNAKVVATQLGFSNHKELAAYMLSNNYVWDSEADTYVKKASIEVLAPSPSFLESEAIASDETCNKAQAITHEEEQLFVEYLPILKILKQNEAKLIDILKPYGASGSIPRYMIPGIPKTKTVQMVYSLNQLVVDFANEKSMTQRDVFEVALIDFFKNYGYQHQVENLLE